MKFAPQTISEFVNLMFFDNGIEVTDRVKKLRTTKQIKQSAEFLQSLREAYKKRSIKCPGAMYHGELYSGREIQAYDNELIALKNFRALLFAGGFVMSDYKN